MTGRQAFFRILGVTLMATVVSCGDDDPVQPTGDTTAPQVISHNPTNGDTNIGVDEEVRIVFSEAMDPNTAQGNVALSSGTVSSLDWLDERTLKVDHTTWSEGVEVTVTLSTGLQDTSGNGLETSYTFSFWTESTNLVFLASDPADGATGVIRNTLVLMLFSADMNLTTLAAATTVADTAGTQTFPFDLERGEEDWVIMNLQQTLPASTAIRVSVGTAAQDNTGRNLSAPASFVFTTGIEVDTTPPQILSFEPPSGSVMDPNTSFLRITFSEPMNIDSLNPTRLSADLFLAVTSDPVWSQNNTVLTVALSTPLPAGLPLEVTFSDFADQNGVVQNNAFTWTARVAGTADYFPVEDGARFLYEWSLAEGTLDDPNPVDEFNGFDHIQINEQIDGTFHWADYDDETYTTTTDWLIFRKTTSALDWLGFHDSNQDIVFDTPLPYLQFPIQLGNWTVPSGAIVGSDTLDIDWTGTVLAREDLPIPEGGDGFLFWKDTWKVELDLVVTAADTVFFTRVDTLWYATARGIVHESSYEENPGEDRWAREVRYLLPDLP